MISRRSSRSTAGRNLHYTLGEYILDLVQNSVEAKAEQIELVIDESNDRVRVALRDTGVGMDVKTLQRALDPFYTDGVKHPNRSVGLGLPFLRQMIESIKGDFSIESELGRGTEVDFAYSTTNIDAPPVGDIPAVLRHVLCFPGRYELTVTRRRGNGEYTLRRSDLIEALGELDTVGSHTLLGDYIDSHEESIEDNRGEAEEWQR